MDDLRIGVLYSPFDRLANKEVERDLEEMGLCVESSLRKRGFSPILIDIDKAGFAAIKEMRPDLLFNVCERLHGDSAYEPHIASLLEQMNINITGSAGSVIALCNNKVTTKAMAQHIGAHTPAHDVLFSKDQPMVSQLKFPVIIKPSAMHNSIGIYKDSIAYNEEDMRKKVGRILLQYRQPALVEEYIPGKDIEITLIGNNGSTRALEPIEVHYPNLSDASQQFFSYESKWSKDKQESGEYRIAKIEDDVREQALTIAKRCYKLFGLRDYGRVDFRLGLDNSLHLLEVTANPGLSKETSTVLAAEHEGLDHSALINTIFLVAAKRCGTLSKYHAAKLLSEIHAP